MIWSLGGGGEFTTRDRHLGVFKVDQQVAEGTGEAETIWQENKHGSWKNTQLEQEEAMAEETAGKGNGGAVVSRQNSMKCAGCHD